MKYSVWVGMAGDEIIYIADGVKIPAVIMGMKCIENALYPIIQYLAPGGLSYLPREHPYWFEPAMVVYPNEIEPA